jgi:hypothetical protein
MARAMVWLSGLLPYAQCEAVWQHIGRKKIAATSIWRQTQWYGERLHAYLEDQIQASQPDQVDWVEFDHKQPHPKGISIDGGMVNTREEGWRELKVGVVFDIETCFEPHPLTGYLTKMAHGVNSHYTAVLGSKTEFEPACWHLAWQHRVPQATHHAVVADGAAWIWDIADHLFPQAHPVVDWYHATQHLASAAQLRHPDDEAARQTWEATMRAHLYAGKVEMINTALADTPAAPKAHYFETHQHRLNYEQTRLAGFPLGSGTVESGIKQFKQRLSGAGMRWNVTRVQHMASIRATVLSDTFFDIWQVVSLH